MANNTMRTAILTTQSKGQITLPKAWRDELNTEAFQAAYNNDCIMLTPIRTATAEQVQQATARFIKKNRILLKALTNK